MNNNRIKLLVFSTLLLIINETLQAQQAAQPQPEEPKWGIKFSGFVKADLWYDTRLVRGSREDLFLFYPLGENLVNGTDANKTGNTHASPATSRLTGKLFAPDAFGAKTSGVIEADFSGSTNAGLNEFRLRHAYVKLEWDKLDLIIGQYWHPMFVPEVFPDVVSLNTGAPFQPFIRNPLVQLSYKITPELRVIGAAITQRDNATISAASGAPDPTPLRYGKIPNLHVQVQYNNGSIVAGLAADYKRVRPRLLTTNSANINEQYLSTTAFMAYFKFASGDFTLRAKAIRGQNLTEHLLLGGYAVEAVDPVTLVETYTPYNHTFLWMNPTYGKKFAAGLFVGYAINHGTSANTNGTVYALYPDMKNIEKMYRIAPNVSVTEGKFKACFELEHTAAYFGTPDMNDKNLVKNSKKVANNRALLTFFYFF